MSYWFTNTSTVNHQPDINGTRYRSTTLQTVGMYRNEDEEERKGGKRIPPNNSWLGVLEDRLPVSEDAVDSWTAATGRGRKRLELGVDSSVASAAEGRGSEWVEG